MRSSWKSERGPSIASTSRASRRVNTLKSLRAVSVCLSVHPSARRCLLCCLSLSIPGPGTTGGIRWCRGGRSSKRPTQFQPGPQLLLVLRRSAENERNERRVRGDVVARCNLIQTLVSPGSPGADARRKISEREVRT